ncbi:triphosphoribosyl-dephospho-CoA synthase [Streptomyces sp. J2-1]|uniref:triphosphoribosyl-dephospho-CoA synthase n=1 Tax=Streptomyces corallincola TaxID=2851888 RepID=UPI001C38693E|nr:triphosphoribosyl-dephospho-CoA synthase [Streptomyces corallincola]MBV2353875.1 triphosphoribosyl-dephospho-CoA synthase [Streptomyces corallincola]
MSVTAVNTVGPGPATPSPTAPTPHTPDLLADLAVRALTDEARLTPKPGLVDRRGSGAHHDMDLGMLLASAESLRDGFADMARAARRIGTTGPALRGELARVGRAAETRMLAVTGGVNTHRGAIWALGLLTGAAALGTGDPCRLAAETARHPDPAAPRPGLTHGALVRLRYGSGGARTEAQRGFPHVRRALGTLRTARAAGADETQARLDALLSLIAALDDTCLLHRGGREGLALAQSGARAVLHAGGTATPAGRTRLAALDTACADRRLSPGGSADLLAAALYLDALDRAPATRPLSPRS